MPISTPQAHARSKGDADPFRPCVKLLMATRMAGGFKHIAGAYPSFGVDTQRRTRRFVASSEKPENADQPLGQKALDWIKKNAPKAAGGAWKIGSAVTTELLKEASMRYYGFK